MGDVVESIGHGVLGGIGGLILGRGGRRGSEDRRPAPAPAAPVASPVVAQQNLAKAHEGEIKKNAEVLQKKNEAQQAKIATGMERQRRRRTGGFGAMKQISSSADMVSNPLNPRLG